MHHQSLLPVAYQCGLHLQNAAGISRCNNISLKRLNQPGLAVAERLGHIGLHEVKNARGAAADGSFRNFRKLQPGNARKEGTRLEANALRMLQVA